MFPSNMDDKRKKARYELAAEDQTWLSTTAPPPHQVRRMASTGDLDAPELRKQDLDFNDDVPFSTAPSELWGGDTNMRGGFKTSA